MRARAETGDDGHAPKRSVATHPSGAGNVIRRMPVNPYAAAYLYASQRSAAVGGGGDAPPVELLRAAQARVFQNDAGATAL